MPAYTPAQYIDRLNKQIQTITSRRKEVQALAYRLVTIADKRIFDRGQDSTGAPIGSYSTKSLYVNTTKAGSRKKVAPKGKESSSGAKFKNGKTRKSTFFSTYQAYKQSQGMAQLGNSVNLQITKAFRRGFLTKSFPITMNGSMMIVSIGVRAGGANTQGKLEGLMQDKYPHAFKLTKEEKAFVIEQIRLIFIKALRT